MGKSFCVLFILVAVAIHAATFDGSVRHFTGRTVETNRPYSYYALSTNRGERILLPRWVIPGKIPVRNRLHAEGTVENLACTDMSRACPTGAFTQVQRMDFDF